MRLLAISGSLRAGSSNGRLLEAAQRLAPAGVIVTLYDGVAELPQFNPDLDGEAPPAAVADLRRRVGESDGLVISSPEYAHGVPGSLKNLLDWLVPATEFGEMPVALLNASPSSEYAEAHLRDTLAVMQARIVEPASISVSLRGAPTGAEAIAAHPEHGPRIAAAMAAFAGAIEAFGPRFRGDDQTSAAAS